MTGPEPVVEIRDLSFRYPKTLSGRQVTALNHVSLTIRKGEYVLVTGQSGSGKSTLARCLNGLIPHETKGTVEGDVIVCGMNTREFDVPDFARHVGMVFQDPGYQLVTGDVESEIAFGLEHQDLPEHEIRQRIDETLDLLRIAHLIGRSTRDLSWGERQRVAIASVVALRPTLLVLDEPFSGIDATVVQTLASLLLDLRSSLGTTIIVFEHRTAPLLPKIDRRIELEAGCIISDRGISPEGNRKMGYGSGEPCPALSSSEYTRGSFCSTFSVHSRVGTVQTPALLLQEVSYRYPGRQDPALDRITLGFYPGEITILTGANGAGKTTLLKHCNSLLRPDKGAIILGTEPLAGKTVAATARTAGLLNQHADYQLFESTIFEELAFGPKNTGKNPADMEKIIGEVRHRCALGHIDPATPPLSLSGGEKQRVALAGILAMDTPIVILDEPTFGLDQDLKNRIAGVVRDLRDAGKTIIIATHDEDFGRSCGDRFIRIAGGRIVLDHRIPSGTALEEDPAGKSAIPPGEDSSGSC